MLLSLLTFILLKMKLWFYENSSKYNAQVAGHFSLSKEEVLQKLFK